MKEILSRGPSNVAMGKGAADLEQTMERNQLSLQTFPIRSPTPSGSMRLMLQVAGSITADGTPLQRR